MSNFFVASIGILGILAVYALLVCKDYNEKEINK